MDVVRDKAVLNVLASFKTDGLFVSPEVLDKAKEQTNQKDTIKKLIKRSGRLIDDRGGN